MEQDALYVPPKPAGWIRPPGMVPRTQQDELYVPPKPAGWVPPPGMVPRTQAPVCDIGRPQYPLYPATGPPPPAQVSLFITNNKQVHFVYSEFRFKSQFENHYW